MVNFGYPYNDLVICKDSTDYLANRDFLENRNINERNLLLDLVQNISPDSEEEVNFIDHSIVYIL